MWKFIHEKLHFNTFGLAEEKHNQVMSSFLLILLLICWRRKEMHYNNINTFVICMIVDKWWYSVYFYSEKLENIFFNTAEMLNVNIFGGKGFNIWEKYWDISMSFTCTLIAPDFILDYFSEWSHTCTNLCAGKHRAYSTIVL